MTCDCCGGEFEDAVAHLLIEEAVLRHQVVLEEKRERDRQAWMEAEEQLAAVRAAR